MPDTLTRLAAVIAERRGAPANVSYVAALHAKGLPGIAQKLGEEAVETVIAALSDDRRALIGEAADLLFHLMVLLGAKQVAIAEVLAELDRRDGVSGLTEKAARKAVEPPAPLPVAAAPTPLPVRAENEPALALGTATPAAKRPRIRKG